MSVQQESKKKDRSFVEDTDDADFPLPLSKKTREGAGSTGAGTETETSSDSAGSAEDDRLQRMADALRTIIECMGDNPDREGVQSTPLRAAKALCFFTKGYAQTPEGVVGEGVFHEETRSDMVLVRDIEVHSLCEHHMVPFSGRVHIAYIPNGRILGLSKLARIADVYARRLQVQERLTRQIAEAIERLVQPKGVAVMMEASHMCMVMRGVEKSGASTTTSTFLGDFENDKDLRREFIMSASK